MSGDIQVILIATLMGEIVRDAGREHNHAKGGTAQSEALAGMARRTAPRFVTNILFWLEKQIAVDGSTRSCACWAQGH